MTKKELIAEVKTIQKLNADKKIAALCDILLEVIKAIPENKEKFGFRSSND